MEARKDDSCLRKYSETSRGVLKIYDMRFKIVTVYVVGLLSSLVISLNFKNSLGFLIGAISTIVMYRLDEKMHRRQSLFAFVSAKLEDKLRTERKTTGDDRNKPASCSEEDLCCFYNMYFETFWGIKIGELTLEKMKDKWRSYYFFSRGWLYLVVAAIMFAMAFIGPTAFDGLIHLVSGWR